MKYLLLIVMLSNLALAQEVLWWDDFEDYTVGQTNLSTEGGGPGPYDRQQNCQCYHMTSTLCCKCSQKTGTNSHVISDQTAFNGTQALKAERNNGDTYPKHDKCTARNEMVTPPLWNDGDDVWIGYALFLASKPEYGANGKWRNTPGASRTVLINQVTKGSPTFHFRLNWDYDDGSYFFHYSGKNSNVPLLWDQWNTVVLRLLWKNPGGRVQVWQNGQKVLDIYDDHPQGGYKKFKFGQYANTPAAGYPQIMFFDDLKIARGSSLLDFVTPKKDTSQNKTTSPADMDYDRLIRNYPNPFNPETQISFDVPAASYATVRIYNTNGSPVRTLVDGYYEANSYEITWYGKDDSGTPLPSGVYIYKLKSGKYGHTAKMMMLR